MIWWMAEINFHEKITVKWKRPGHQTLFAQTWTTILLLALWPNMEVDENNSRNIDFTMSEKSSENRSGRVQNFLKLKSAKIFVNYSKWRNSIYKCFNQFPAQIKVAALIKNWFKLPSNDQWRVRHNIVLIELVGEVLTGTAKMTRISHTHTMLSSN